MPLCGVQLSLQFSSQVGFSRGQSELDSEKKSIRPLELLLRHRGEAIGGSLVVTNGDGSLCLRHQVRLLASQWRLPENRPLGVIWQASRFIHLLKIDKLIPRPFESPMIDYQDYGESKDSK